MFTHQGHVSKLFIHSHPGFLVCHSAFYCEALRDVVGGRKVAQQWGRTCRGGRQTPDGHVSPIY